MITKEWAAGGGEEVFAVDGKNSHRPDCRACVYFADDRNCAAANCRPHERTDSRNVFFRPITDVKTSLALTIQKNP